MLIAVLPVHFWGFGEGSARNFELGVVLIFKAIASREIRLCFVEIRRLKAIELEYLEVCYLQQFFLYRFWFAYSCK